MSMVLMRMMMVIGWCDEGDLVCHILEQVAKCNYGIVSKTTHFCSVAMLLDTIWDAKALLVYHIT